MGQAASTRDNGREEYRVKAGFGALRINDRIFTSIFIGTVIALFTLGALAYITQSVFFIDALISIAVVSVVYYYRKDLLFSWEGTLLCCVGWLMNMLGTLGAYEIYVAGLGWDKALHFVSILGVTLLAYAYLTHRNLKPVEAAIIAFLIAQGFGAINEIAEFIGTHYFGAGQGLFGMVNGLSEPANKFAQYDTHWDMITNTTAILVGLAYAAMKRRAQIYKTTAASQ